MFENLAEIKDNFKELETKISDPEVMKDMENWQKLVREHADLRPIIEKYDKYDNAIKTIKEDKSMLNEEIDDEMKDMLKEEISSLEADLERYEEELKVLLLPKDPNDHKNVFLEIRAGAGGEEAGLFAGELLRMYQMFSDNQGWQTEVMEIQDQGVGGIKEAVVMIKGSGAYSKLKYESGVHRVQRVPTTESSGRIHTSAATVAVLPEADDVDVDIEAKDIRVDVFRSSGHGGQSVNTTDSAVRITHIPTGIVVSCQDEKSQLKNKDKAMKILKSRLYDLMLEEQNKDIASDRRSQVGSGDRSERIRTYNFPQGRVTDHRINLTLYRLQDFLDGNIEEMLDSLITFDQTEKLKLVG